VLLARFCTAVLLSLLLVACASPAAAPADAFAAYEAGDYQAALQIWQQQAVTGAAEAQFQLAVLYDQPHAGIVADAEEAFRWYLRAAEQGHRVAQFNTGNAYKHGRGTQQDDTLAITWWQRAADQGFSHAQYNLAIQFHQGLGVTEDRDRALLLFNLAARNGQAQAQALLASGRIARFEPVWSEPTVAAVTNESPLDPPISALAANEITEEPVSGEPVSVLLANEIAGEPVLAGGIAAASELEPGGSDRRWLLGQEPGAFTLQIGMSTGSPEEERQRLNMLLDGIGSVRVLAAGSGTSLSYYYLLGSYGDAASAQAVVARLPAAIRQAGPWARQFSHYRQLLRL
jgi:septal ring-binding cell division protein DamX